MVDVRYTPPAEVGLSRSVAFKNQRRITLLVHIDRKEKLKIYEIHDFTLF